MTEDQTKEKKKHQEKDGTKPLTELEKYWQVVRDNPADFPGWTYLLHYVEQENNIEAAREAFAAFFARYPYCYGYWKKYADMERTLNSPEAAEQVFEDGIKAIPLSIDLWMHYLNFAKVFYKDEEDSYTRMKELFKRAVAAAGQEFRSDRLWDAYIGHEEENKKLKEVTAIYDTLLTIPTQMYSHHFDKFSKHVKSNFPRDILTTDEFLELRREVLADHVEDDEEIILPEKAPVDALPPGVDDDAPPGVEAPDKIDKDMMTEAQIELMRKKVIEKRKALFDKNEAEVGRRWTYEEGIKRPYFHVKALERAQLSNWKDYLDFEIENGVHERTVILFERCMIACALYEDLWMKYAKYMEEKAPEQAGNVYERACTIHLQKKPMIHYAWSAYEELKGNSDKACLILENFLKSIPDLIETICRLVNIERRRGNLERVDKLYVRFITETKSVKISSAFAKKYARFLYKTCGNEAKAREVLQEAISKDSTNASLYLQLADIAFQSNPVDEDKFCEAFDMALQSDIHDDIKVMFSRRKFEFYEDFGTDPKKNQLAFEDYSKRLKQYNVNRKRMAEEAEELDKSKKVKTEVNGVPASSTTPDAATTAVAAVATTAATTTAAAATSQDAASYYQQSQHWMGYQHNNYNYHQSWNPYHSSYYSNH